MFQLATGIVIKVSFFSASNDVRVYIIKGLENEICKFDKNTFLGFVTIVTSCKKLLFLEEKRRILSTFTLPTEYVIF